MIKADQLSPSCDIETGENLNVFHYIPKWNKAHFYSVYLCNGINKWNYTSNYKSGQKEGTVVFLMTVKSFEFRLESKGSYTNI